MMNNESIIRYCLSKPGAYEDFPFGPIPACYKVCGKLFMQLYPMPENHKITLSCEPMLADFYRQQYPGVVIPGYHCPDRLKPYMNTVYLGKGIADEQILEMIDHSFGYVVNKLTRKQKAALAEAAESGGSLAVPAD